MIRLADHKDISGIISLWHECFGDSEKEISFFLKEKFVAENTVVFEENGNIVSMLFLLEGEMHINDSDYPAYYLYAACTSKKCRGRGLMAKLLSFTQSIAKERKFAFICLMPAEKSLFDFYSKHGYTTFFERKKLKLTKSDVNDYSSNIVFEPGFDNFDLQSLRDKSLNTVNYFKWNNKSINFAFEHTKLYFGWHFISCKGYALCSINDSGVYVKEYTFPQSDLLSFAKYLFKNLEIDNIIFNLPAEFQSHVGEFEIEPSGMILPLSDEYKLLIKNKAYLGLTLD